MSYCVMIEGSQGVRKVHRGRPPRRGEWLAVELSRAWWWLPVLEVGHALSKEKVLEEPQDGCEYLHEAAETIVFSSFSVGVRVETRFEDEEYKLVLPPPRWPFGGGIGPEEGEKEKEEKGEAASTPEGGTGPAGG